MIGKGAHPFIPSKTAYAPQLGTSAGVRYPIAAQPAYNSFQVEATDFCPNLPRSISLPIRGISPAVIRENRSNPCHPWAIKIVIGIDHGSHWSDGFARILSRRSGLSVRT